MLASAVVGPDNNETTASAYDDMDDYNGLTVNMTDLGATSTQAGDVIDANVSMAVTVSYANDAANYNTQSPTFNFPGNTGASSNIKNITLTLTSSNPAGELSKTIVLRAFGCNIGGYKLVEKTR